MAGWRGLFDVRAGERRATFVAFGLFFLIIAGHTALEAARDALFLGNLETRELALVYVVLAGTAWLALAGSRLVARRIGEKRALALSLYVAAAGTVGFYFAPRTDAAIFGLYLWSGLIGTFVAVQFWLLVGDLFTVAQGKRIFGLLTAGGALGATVGAALAALVLRYVAVDQLLLFAPGLFVLGGIGLVSLPRPAHKQTSALRLRDDAKRDRREASRSYVRRLTLYMVFAGATILTTDYLFKVAAKALMDPDELGEFFAISYAAFNGLALVFQLIGAGYIVRRFGVMSAIYIMPLLLAVGGAAVAVLGLFAVIVGAKAVDGSLRHSLHRVTTELMWMPVPRAIKASTKATLDGLVARAVQAATALALLGLAVFSLDTPLVLGCLLAGFAVLWLFFAVRMRGPYVDLYRQSLEVRRFSALADVDLQSMELLVAALSAPERDKVLAAIDLLRSQDRSRLIPSLILYHDDPEVLESALDTIAVVDRHDWHWLAQKLLDHERPEVRAAAIRALARVHKLAELDLRLGDVDPTVRATAAFWLAEHEGLAKPYLDSRVVEVTSIPGAAGVRAKVALLLCVARDGDARWSDWIYENLQSDDAAVALAAAKAAPIAGEARLIPLLIERLALRSGRDAVRDALARLGDPALSAMAVALSDDSTPLRVRVHLPHAIEYFRSQRAADVLVARLPLENAGVVRFRILRWLARLARREPVRVRPRPVLKELKRNLDKYFLMMSWSAPLKRPVGKSIVSVRSHEFLVKLLEDKERQSLERSFLCLQALSRHENLRTLLAAVESGESGQLANASEVIDNITSRPPYTRYRIGSDVRRLLRIALDDLAPAVMVLRAGEPEHPVSSAHDALLAMMDDQEEIVASAAAFYAASLDDPALAGYAINVAKERNFVGIVSRHSEVNLRATGAFE